jgi:hypothetical protein
MQHFGLEFFWDAVAPQNSVGRYEIIHVVSQDVAQMHQISRFDSWVLVAGSSNCFIGVEKWNLKAAPGVDKFVKLFTIMLSFPAFLLSFDAYDNYFSKDGYGNT